VKKKASKLAVFFLVAGTSILLPAQAQANTGLQVTIWDNYTGQYNRFNDAPPIPPTTNIVASFIAPVVDYDFDSYIINRVPHDDFIVKYEGYLTANESGTANLQCLADDGCIVIIDGATIINEWYDKGTSGDVYPYQLVPNQSLPFTLWYYENGGGAVVQLRWQIADRDWAVVPASVFSIAPISSPIETQTVVSEETSTGPSASDTSTPVFESSTAQQESQTSTVDSPTASVSDTPTVTEETSTVVETPTAVETVTSESSTQTSQQETTTTTTEVPIQPLPTPEPVVVVPEPVRPEPVVVPEPQPEPQPQPEPEPEPLPEETDTETPLEEPPLEEEPVAEEPVPVEEPSEYPEEEEMNETPVEPEIQEQPEQTPEPLPQPIVTPEPTLPVDVAPEPPITSEPMVTLDNGVVLTEEEAAAVVLLQNPAELLAELFTDPGAVLTALGSIGADMSPEVREKSEKVIISAVIAGNIATQAAASAGAVAAYRRKP
jgi:hypothetical protein